MCVSSRGYEGIWSFASPSYSMSILECCLVVDGIFFVKKKKKKKGGGGGGGLLFCLFVVLSVYLVDS